MVRERDHGTDRRASLCRGAGGAIPGGAGRDRGAALPGDLAAGAGAHRAGGFGGAGLRAALGGGTGAALRRNASGPEAPGDQRRRDGRAATPLAEAVLAALAKRVRTPPEDGGLWSGPEAAAWMARRFGLQKAHPQR